jgi:exodeoxyribonuclease VII small subunit
MARRKTPIDPDLATPTFEDALVGLESIVESMEHEQLPLEELVDSYEKGSALLDHCETLLQSARERITLITLRNKNAADLDPESSTEDSPDPSLPSGTPEAPDDDDDDIRLF